MCHDEDSRPPSPPIVGAVLDHGLLTLPAADGNTFAAYQAMPAQGGDKAVVILPDVRGLHPYYEQLAVRFAEAGFRAATIDYFGRSLGVGVRDDSLDWQTEIRKVRPEFVQADVAAAANYLRRDHEYAVFTVGFCFGGSQSWRLSASELELSACMGFYGHPSMVSDVEDRIRHLLLMLVVGADMTPQEEFQQFDARLSRSGRALEMYVYDGAPHSFFGRSYGQWSQACADSWRRILSFTDTYA
jgi:carboxymethylenebutenolidase